MLPLRDSFAGHPLRLANVRVIDVVIGFALVQLMYSSGYGP